jgi:hypothetical protein
MTDATAKTNETAGSKSPSHVAYQVRDRFWLITDFELSATAVLMPDD